VTSVPRPEIWRALVFGLVAGLLGAAWIVAEHTRKGYALGYHVPLAVVFTAALVDVVFDGLVTRKFGFVWASAVAGAVIVGRMKRDWPLSGHGILGLLMAVSPIRPAFRVCGILIAIQAIVTKVVIGEPEHWQDVIWGALCGVAIGLIGRLVDRRATRSPA
jgi:hypothetical protein